MPVSVPQFPYDLFSRDDFTLYPNTSTTSSSNPHSANFLNDFAPFDFDNIHPQANNILAGESTYDDSSPVSEVGSSFPTPAATPYLADPDTPPRLCASLSSLTEEDELFHLFDPEIPKPPTAPTPQLDLIANRCQALAFNAVNTATVQISVADLNTLLAAIDYQKQQLLRHQLNCVCPAACDITSPLPSPASVSIPIASPVIAPTDIQPHAAPAADLPSRRRVSKVYHCEQPGCNRSFSRKFNLATHLETHDPNRARPFQCDICGRSFTRQPDLIRHGNVHTNRRREHACGACGRVYARKDALCRHLNVCPDTASAASPLI